MRSRVLGILLASSLIASAQPSAQTGDPETDAFDCRLITSADLTDATAPTFRSFPADTSVPAGHAPLDLSSNPLAWRYRTILRQQMGLGPNFAGHYRLAIWGCGSSCAELAVVDLKSGRVITPASVKSVSGVLLAADDFLVEGFGDRAWAFRARKDSRLLVLVGSLNEDDQKTGAFYYLLTKNRLKLVHTTLAKKKNCPAGPANRR